MNVDALGLSLLVGLSLIGLASCSPSSVNPAVPSSPHSDATANADQPIPEDPSDDNEKPAAADAGETATKVVAKDDTSKTLDITFDDIDLPIDADMVFRPFMMTERAQSLDGKRVRIHGFMLADAQTRGIKEFILVKNTECKFGPGGQADHLVNVKVKIENGVTHRTDAVSIEGVLTINPFTGFDGNTWSIFDMACERLEQFKPRR